MTTKYLDSESWGRSSNIHCENFVDFRPGVQKISRKMRVSSGLAATVVVTNSVTREHSRSSGPLRTRDQRRRLVINRSPSAGHHHRRRRRRRADTRQPTFVQASHCCSSAHLNRSRRLIVIDIVCARHIRTYDSVARSQSLTEAGTHVAHNAHGETLRGAIKFTTCSAITFGRSGGNVET